MVTAVQCENTKASAKTVHRKKSVQPSADVAANDEKSSAPAASHLTALKPENKNPSPESSHTSTSKTKPSESPPKVGKCYFSCLNSDSVSLYELVLF